MPKKVLALAMVAALVLAGVAFASTNIYTLDKASTTPAGKGSSKKPKGKKVVFSFSTNTDDGTRAKVIRFYDIGFQGLKYYGNKMPKCSYTQANQKGIADVQKDCKKAAAGGGTINNFFGNSSDPNAKTQCKLKLRIYNIGNGLALRLDRDKQTDCLIDPSAAIKAKFHTVKIGGIKSVALKFEVGDNFRHPIPNFDNSVNNVTSSVKKSGKVKIGKRKRTVGLLSSVKCGKKGKRTISVKFTDESGVPKNVSKPVKC
jgi:hypothetical protein